MCILFDCVVWTFVVQIHGCLLPHIATSEFAIHRCWLTNRASFCDFLNLQDCIHVSLVDEDFPIAVVWQKPKCWHSPAINALKQDQLLSLKRPGCGTNPKRSKSQLLLYVVTISRPSKYAENLEMQRLACHYPIPLYDRWKWYDAYSIPGCLDLPCPTSKQPSKPKPRHAKAFGFV